MLSRSAGRAVRVLTGRRFGPRRTLLVAVTAVAVASAVPVAIGAGEGDPIIGGERNPSENQALELQEETQIIAAVSTYGTRQSNKSDNGGGAIYGCRSAEGGTPEDNEPCIRANNLRSGLAFEFETNGNVGGTIVANGDLGEENPVAVPFRTNAGGRVDNLNADEVDGLHAFSVAVSAAGEVQAESDEAFDVTRSAQGTYAVDVPAGAGATCYLQGTARSGPAFVVADTAADAPTRATVRTYAPGGQLTDAAFFLTATCQTAVGAEPEAEEETEGEAPAAQPGG